MNNRQSSNIVRSNDLHSRRSFFRVSNSGRNLEGISQARVLQWNGSGGCGQIVSSSLEQIQFLYRETGIHLVFYLPSTTRGKKVTSFFENKGSMDLRFGKRFLSRFQEIRLSSMMNPFGIYTAFKTSVCSFSLRNI